MHSHEIAWLAVMAGSLLIAAGVAAIVHRWRRLHDGGSTEHVPLRAK